MEGRDRLLNISDVLNSREIRKGLQTQVIGKEIHYFKSLDSTNNYAKKLAAVGCKDGTLIVADNQTRGRGRGERSWHSENEKGIWMSLVLKPPITFERAQVTTLAISVALVLAIEKTINFFPGIKWPNDILLDGKKVCGILTEMNSYPHQINYIIVGIGINANQGVEDFQREIRENATSLRIFKNCPGRSYTLFKRSAIIKNVLLEIEKIYDDIKKGETEKIIKEWKKYSITLGKEIVVYSKNGKYTGIAKDITDKGKLVVEDSNGVIRELVSEEVSIRNLNIR